MKDITLHRIQNSMWIVTKTGNKSIDVFLPPSMRETAENQFSTDRENWIKNQNMLVYRFSHMNHEVPNIGYGLYAIALVVEMCYGNDVKISTDFQGIAMKDHFIQCLKKKEFTVFPK